MSQAYANKMIALPGAILKMRERDLMRGGSDAMLEIPVPSFLVEHPQGLVLFDTGVNPRVAEDPEGYWGPAAKFLNVSCTPEQIVDRQVRAHGYKPEDVKFVVVSHLHLDHAGGLALFPNAQFVIMKGELPYAYWPDRRARGGFILGDLLPTRGFNWRELTEDTDLFGEGSVSILRTTGHTPGECSMVVRLKQSGPIALTGDTIHIRRQLDTLAAMAGDFDESEASRSIKRLKEMQDSKQARLWISHAPEDWANYPHEMD